MCSKDAQAALIRFNSFEKFTISSKPVTADYIHAGVFVPVFNATEASPKFTFSPLGNTATKLAYWDEQAWVSESIVSSTTPKEIAAAHDNQVRSASDLLAAAAENEGLLKPGKETEAKTKKRKVEASDTTKQKKVNGFQPITQHPLMVIDYTSAPAILEQPPCRASWCQT